MLTIKCHVLHIYDAAHNKIDLNFYDFLLRVAKIVPVEEYTVSVITFDADDSVLSDGTPEEQASLCLKEPRGLSLPFSELLTAVKKTNVGETHMVFIKRGEVITDSGSFILCCADDTCIFWIKAVNKRLLNTIASQFKDFNIRESELEEFFLDRFSTPVK